jgi:hypothetical protein
MAYLLLGPLLVLGLVRSSNFFVSRTKFSIIPDLNPSPFSSLFAT